MLLSGWCWRHLSQQLAQQGGGCCSFESLNNIILHLAGVDEHQRPQWRLICSSCQLKYRRCVLINNSDWQSEEPVELLQLVCKSVNYPRRQQVSLSHTYTGRRLSIRTCRLMVAVETLAGRFEAQIWQPCIELRENSNLMLSFWRSNK